jgi:patatin-related protein
MTANDPGKTSRPPLEEIRCAVVLNGGVSLAVWMGGAVQEIDRMTRDTGPYHGLLEWLRCTARVDVISGTSAGGINGAALALAQANRAADLSSLRDVWVEEGDLEELLQRPFRGSPTSLLRGDDYFLPRLHETMRALAEAGGNSPDPTAPEPPSSLDLTITTTLLRPVETTTVDDFGESIPQNVHEAFFRFRRPVPGDPDGAGDPFEPTALSTTAAELALASRCTSSFPVAFEPAFVPVWNHEIGDQKIEDLGQEWRRLHPNMGQRFSIENQHSFDPGDIGADRSRFVADGGVLANMPTRRALDAIAQVPPGDRPVHRVMLLVHPHVGRTRRPPGDDPRHPPTTVAALAAVESALISQGQRSHEEEIERHNQRVASRRGTRKDLLLTLARGVSSGKSTATSGEAGLTWSLGDFDQLTALLYWQYRALRRARAGRDLADVTHREGFSRNQIRRAASEAQVHWLRDHQGELPYSPIEPPSLDQVAVTAGSPWRWGVSGALGVAEGAEDLLRLVLNLLPATGSTGAATSAGRVTAARRTVAQARQRLWAVRRRLNDVWSTAPLSDLAPTPELFTLRQSVYTQAMLGPADVGRDALDDAIRAAVAATAAATGQGWRPRRPAPGARDVLAGLGIAPDDDQAVLPDLGRHVVRQVADVAGAVTGILDLLATVTASGEDGERLHAWRVLLSDSGSRPAGADQVAQRLLALEVITAVLGDEPSQGPLTPIEAVLVSGWTEQPFSTQAFGPADKLGGMTLGHFGGFLKRSWRMNDWIWGRLDAANVLCRMLLTPDRVQRALGAEHGRDAEAVILDRVLLPLFGRSVADRIIHPGRQTPVLRRLRECYLKAVRDVEALRKADVAGRTPIPSLAALVTWGLAVGIMGDDVDSLELAILADRRHGADRRSYGEGFLDRAGDTLKEIARVRCSGGEPPPTHLLKVLDAFVQAGVGSAPLRAESASDEFLRMAVSGVAVAATVLDGDGSGFTALRPVTRALRGAALLPYWVVRGLTAGGAVARSLALLGLAVGGVLFALSLLGLLPQALGSTGVAVGVGALLSAFGYSALRSGTVLHGLALLTPVAPLLFWATQRALAPGTPTATTTPDGASVLGTQQATSRGVSTVVVVIAVTIGLIALGSLPAASRSVFGTLDAVADRLHLADAAPLVRWGKALLILLARAAAVIGGLALFWVAFVHVADGTWTAPLIRMHDHPSLVALGCLLVLGLGTAIARLRGNRLRVLTADSDPANTWGWRPLSEPAAVSAGWSVVYGAGYLVITEVFVYWDRSAIRDQPWARALALTGLTFAAVLLLVVPAWLPGKATRRILREETDRAGWAATRLRSADARNLAARRDVRFEQRTRLLTDDLVARRRSYRFLITRSTGGLDALALTRAGRQLLDVYFPQV